MDHPLQNINWLCKTEVIDRLIDSRTTLSISPMPSGLEAEVIQIHSGDAKFVLKIWNRSSKPDVQYQYEWLRILRERGLSVSEPFGCGRDGNSNPVLLTSFDGNSIQKLSVKAVADISKLLSGIHNTSLEMSFPIRKHDFIEYFYPGILEFPDLHNPLKHLVEMSKINQGSIIHGDFNLGNIVEKDGHYTVIDWTNGQLGDYRYDMAWSATLMMIYTSERYASLFRSAYQSQNPIAEEEYPPFEAMSCLRWILLDRLVGLPKRSNTVNTVRHIIKANIHLRDIEYLI